MITIKDIQKKVSESIKYSGMTQAEIARKIGVKQQQISSYLYGKTCPSVDTLANLCQVLDLDANEVLCLK